MGPHESWSWNAQNAVMTAMVQAPRKIVHRSDVTSVKGAAFSVTENL